MEGGVGSVELGSIIKSESKTEIGGLKPSGSELNKSNLDELKEKYSGYAQSGSEYPSFGEVDQKVFDKYGTHLTGFGSEAQEGLYKQALGEIYNEGKINPLDLEAVEKQSEIQRYFETVRDDYLDKIDESFDTGVFPADLKEDRWRAIMDTKVVVRTNLGSNEGAINKTHLDYDNESHCILISPDILEQTDKEHTFRHELTHVLEGNDLGAENEQGMSGLRRLFLQDNFLGTAIDEGMTDIMTEIISGNKVDYSSRESDGVQKYHIYRDFIIFLCTKGQRSVDINYFVKAYTLNGQDGERAICDLKQQINDAFPMPDNSDTFDTFAKNSVTQMMYWMSEYTGHTEIAEMIKSQLGKSQESKRV